MTLQTYTESRQAYNALVKIERFLTVEESIERSPLICAEGKKIGVVAQIIRIIEFFLEVTGKELEGYQIQILAGDLYEKFKTDSLDDVVLMFKMARQGEFGKVYKCDTFEIINWANQYLDFKSATRERLINKKKKKTADEEITGKSFHELPPELQQQFNKIGKTRMMTRKATEMMTTEKNIRDLEKPKDKKEVLKADKAESLFSYDAFLEDLRGKVGKMYDDALRLTFANTSKSVYPEVWEILNTEIELRKTQKELKK